MAEYKVGGIDLQIKSTEQVLKEQEVQDNAKMAPEPVKYEYDNLMAHLISEFNVNKQAKDDAGIVDDIMDSRRAYAGKYSTDDKAKIIEAGGGSEIFMNITATKARACRSWITDILKPPVGKPWGFKPTPLEDLPADIQKLIRDKLADEFKQMRQPQQPPQPQGGPPQLQQGQAGKAPQEMTAKEAADTIREQNQMRRDLEQAIADEIHREAEYQLRRMERKVEDQLVEGDWDQALADFIDDFVVDPTAFMKGPVVTMGTGLVWNQGFPVETRKIMYKNCRVDALDIYPSPTQTTMHDGNMFEHMRFSKGRLEALRGVESYIDEKIDMIITEYDAGIKGSWVDTSIETERAEIEKRGSFIDTNRNVFHALHFWGDLTVKQLMDWEYFDKVDGLIDQRPEHVVAVEAIMVGNHIIKCVINDDPLKRRPYYKASYMNVPGSFWGRSLPMVMSPQQRMCNAVARALANNLGVASGPQIELYVDRIADNYPIEEVTPFKIWQLKSDPSGAGGRAINFWQPTSNAGELLKVYNEFEAKADDVTGIPKYAYGNEKTAGATNTAAGLAMLLESTSKIIKDCIRNIDDGLIKPRVKYQFHYNMLNKPTEFQYTGDINVVTVGSQTLTIRGAEATKRNEFLQATANEQDMAVMGYEGRAEILRKMAEDLGLPAIIPTKYEIKQKVKKQEESQAQQAQQMAQAEQMKAQTGLQATQIQVQGQAQMHQGTLQKEMARLQADMQKFMKNYELAMGELQLKARKLEQDASIAGFKIQTDKDKQTQEVALKLSQGSGI